LRASYERHGEQRCEDPGESGMKLDGKDFKYLQWAIALLVIMAVIGGGSVWTTLKLKKDGQRAFQEAAAARKDIQTKLARASEEQQELREKIERFQTLKTRGLIGPERRLDWIEAIARLKAAHRISKLDYEFAAQRPVDASMLPAGAVGGGFEIMSSQMRLQLHVMHEGELLALLAELRKAVQALVQVRSCNIERLAADTSDRNNNAQLKAECIVEWITLREGK
jgi:hypothetical protein